MFKRLEFILPILLLAASISGAQAAPIKALTFNVAGIPLLRPHWSRRREAIARNIKESSYDLVALQEVWLDSDARDLVSQAGLPYSARRENASPRGGGLLFLSRFPILTTHHAAFSAAGAGGVLVARVKTPGGELDVYTARLTGAPLRQTQVFELFELISSFSAGRPILIMGDLNSSPQDPDYNLLADLLDLQDFCLKDGYDHCGNSNPGRSKRVDHILLPATGRRGPSFAARLDFTGPVPGTSIPYSNHKAVSVELDQRILSLRPRGNPNKQAPLLKEMLSRLQGLADSLMAENTGRSWVPVYGAFHDAFYTRQTQRIDAVKNNIESFLIKKYKDCGLKP